MNNKKGKRLEIHFQMTLGLLTPLLVNIVAIFRLLFIHTLKSLYIVMFACSLFVFLDLKLKVISTDVANSSSQFTVQNCVRLFVGGLSNY